MTGEFLILAVPPGFPVRWAAEDDQQRAARGLGDGHQQLGHPPLVHLARTGVPVRMGVPESEEPQGAAGAPVMVGDQVVDPLDAADERAGGGVAVGWRPGCPRIDITRQASSISPSRTWPVSTSYSRRRAISRASARHSWITLGAIRTA